jgi:hypothetical protein
LPFLVAALIAALALGTIISIAQAVQATQTNSTPGTADGSNITRSVEFTTTEFVAGSVITDVIAAVTFEKSNGTSCAAYTGGNVYYQEIYFLLRSPAGTQIVLVEDQANTGGSGQGPTYTDSGPYVGEVTVTFDDEAGSDVQNTVPVSGTFKPVEALSAFDGQNPLGTWTLTVGDSNSFDPLCFSEFTLTINAAEPPTPQPPTVEDQTFSVPENSPNGTSVGVVVADDPNGDKLLYAIDPVDIFDIVANTGEITVIDGSLRNRLATPGRTWKTARTCGSPRSRHPAARGCGP